MNKEKAQQLINNGNYAICPFGTNKKYIWDWQQDCFIDLESLSYTETRNIRASEIEDISLYVSNETDVNPEPKEKISIFEDENKNILGFITEEGQVFNRKEWKAIDWEACGF